MLDLLNRETVPCNGCTACCHNDLIILHPEQGDDIDTYDAVVVKHPLNGKEVYTIRRVPGQPCIYLGAHGCTIHTRAPVICREFDCRKFMSAIGDRASQRRAVKIGAVSREIYDAAKRRTGL